MLSNCRIGMAVEGWNPIQRIEEKIEILRSDVENLGDEGFNDKTRLNVHDLLCFMRLAIWEDKSKFIDWLSKMNHEINPGILSRIVIEPKPNRKKKLDGVELRFHIFKDGSETFIHNHRQDFITIPLQGQYDYTWWAVDHEGIGEVKRWERKKGGELNLIEPRKGVLKKAQIGNDKVKLIWYDVDPNTPSGTFRGGEKPMFVNHRWHHTVKHVGDEPMITFVVRRGKKNEPVTVLSDKEGADEGNEPVRSSANDELTNEELQEIRGGVLDALAPHSVADGQKGYSDLKEYITPTEYLLRVNENDVKKLLDSDNGEITSRLMQSNKFSFLPIIDGSGECTKFLTSGIFHDSDENEIIEPQLIPHDFHILSAILWTVGLKKFIVPVEKDGTFAGIFTFENIMNSEFENALFLALKELPDIRDKQNKKNFISDRMHFAHAFLRKIKDLNRRLFTEQKKMTHEESDEFVHEVLLSLGPLIVMAPKLNLGKVKRLSGIQTKGNVADWARYPMFKFDVASFEDEEELSKAREALSLMHKGGDYSYLALRNPDECYQMLNLVIDDSDNIHFDSHDIKVAAGDEGIQKIVEHFAERRTPLVVENTEGKIGLLTIYELRKEQPFAQLQEFMIRRILEKSLDSQIEISQEFTIVIGMLLNSESVNTEERFSQLCRKLRR